MAAFELPGTPPKKSDYVDALTGSRVRWQGPAVEVEALDPPFLRDLIENQILGHVDPETLRLTRIAERSEREILYRLAGGAA